MSSPRCGHSSVTLDPRRRGDPRLAVDDWEGFRSHLQRLDADAAAELLAQCERTLIFSRHHWLALHGEMRDRQGLSAALAAALACAPGEWTAEQGELVFVLYLLGSANLGLEQVEEVLDTEHVARLVAARERLYREGAGGEPQEDAASPASAGGESLSQAAYRLRDLRHRCEQRAYRYSIIDGERWRLTEGLLPHTAVDTEDVPRALLERLGVQGAGSAALRAAAREHLARDGHAEAAVLGVMRFALQDEELAVDHVTITGPKQVAFPPAERLGERENIYRRTEIRDGVALGDFQEQLGHSSPERLGRVIGARMQVLKLKSAGQFFGSGCMGGEGSEKFGDHMIYSKEDSHYLGHRNGGISTGGRAPIPLAFARDGQVVDLPGIFGDFRAVRLSHAAADRFDVAGLARVIQYAAWLGAILNETYAQGGAISAELAGQAAGAEATHDQLPSIA